MYFKKLVSQYFIILFIDTSSLCSRKLLQWILTPDEPTYFYSSPAIRVKCILAALQHPTTARKTATLPDGLSTERSNGLHRSAAVIALHPAEYRLPGIWATVHAIFHTETEPATLINVRAARLQRLHVLQPSTEPTLVHQRGLVGFSATEFPGIVVHLPSAAAAAFPIDQSKTVSFRIHDR